MLIPASKAIPLPPVPAVRGVSAPAPKKAALTSRSRRDLEKWLRGRKMRKVLAAMLMIGLLVAGFMQRERLAEIFHLLAEPAVPERVASVEESRETAAAVSEVAMAPADAPLDQAEAEEVGEFGEEDDPVGWLLADKSRWPLHVALTEDVRFTVVFNGRAAGTVTVPGGSQVEVTDIGSELIEVRFRGGSATVPHRATDLVSLVPELRQKVEAIAASADSGLITAAGIDETNTRPAADPRQIAAAKKIDSLIAAHHAGNKVPKPALVSDERFLRRAYLTAIGRIPTGEEAAQFLADQNPHKRANLVAALIESPGYASHMRNWMHDRLRIVDQNSVAQIRYPLYREWVRTSVERDVPWDKMVTELLTTNGGGWDKKTAAIGYFTRDRGMPLDNLAVTMRIFLGSRMECAQCHNDPFGETKQKDFFRLAAFTNGLEPMNQDVFRGIYREMMSMPQNSVENRAAWMFWRDIYGSSLAGGGTGRIALPMDYQYKDAKPGDIKGARAPFGKSTKMAGIRDRDDGREKLAEWITQGTGERFAGMIANSMWRRVMGSGYFEPGDEYLEPAEAHDPRLAAHLAGLLQDLQYRLRDFQRVLMLTEAFQFETNPAVSVADGGADDFRGRRVQRMTAEQVWDSLVTLVSGNPDHQPPRQVDERVFINGRPVLEGRMTMAQLSSEVLAITDEDELRDYFMKFVQKVKSGEEGGDAGPMAAMRRDPVGYVRGMHPRAADLDSPAPRNHFVALFGQSTRNTVDGSTREPNMAQVLSLMNGFVQTELINNPEARLNRDIDRASAPGEKIRQLYLSIFSREPSAEELAVMKEEFAASPEGGVANVASAMIMSAEFLYIQ